MFLKVHKTNPFFLFLMITILFLPGTSDALEQEPALGELKIEGGRFSRIDLWTFCKCDQFAFYDFGICQSIIQRKVLCLFAIKTETCNR